jgi:hypothetical protein
MKRIFSQPIPLLLLVALITFSAQAQNLLEEVGSDARLLTASEIKAFRDLVLKVKTLLPVPDTSRYVHNGAAEASTMPFVAEASINSKIAGRSWPLGCFPYDDYSTLLFGYDAKSTVSKPGGKSKNILANTQAMMEALGNRVEIGVRLMPHAYLVPVVNGKMVEVDDPGATNIEKTPNFLSWDANEGTVTTMVFGPRTGKESETLNLDKPAAKFAPLVSIELKITGPKSEVTALKKKIDRQALAALLGTVVK